MVSSDFELVFAVVEERPGSTAREVATALRQRGYQRFTSKLVNQILYRMLTSELVVRDGTSDKPRWSAGRTWKSPDREPGLTSKRPFKQSAKSVIKYRVADTDVRVLLDSELSPNDPYISPDWVGSHVVVSVNTKHPFWAVRIASLTDKALYCMIVAVDAYILWKVAQLHEPPDASEVQKLRDYALRFCILDETETVTDD